MGYDYALEENRFVLSHSRAISQHKDFELTAGVDASLENRNLFEEKFKGKTYANFADSILEETYDFVIIATPTETHFLLVKEILTHIKPKAILCEKPLSYDITESENIVELCAKSNCKLYVNYIRRSEPGAIYIKGIIDNLKKDSVVKGIVWYSKGILNNGSHFLNLLIFWLGEMTKMRVIKANRKFGEHDFEPDVHFEFKKGSVVFLSAREEDFSHYAIELVTSEGRLRYEAGGNKQSWQSLKDNEVFVGYRTLDENEKIIKNEMSRYQWHVMNQISLDLKGLVSNVCSGDEALKTMKVLERVRTEI